MTTLRKKKEFKKSLKKENNKTSKKKLRKRSKNKISKKKKLVAGAIESLRFLSKTRDPNDIYDVFGKIGQRFVQKHKSFLVQNLRISRRDYSVYLNIQFSENLHKDLFHISDHPGESHSACGAVHIKQLHTFEGEQIGRLIFKNGKQEPEGRCFKIIKHRDRHNRLSLYSDNDTNNEDFEKLKSLIEDITEQEVIDLGLYTRPDEDNLRPHTPVNHGTRVYNSDFSTETHPGLTPESLKF